MKRILPIVSILIILIMGSAYADVPPAQKNEVAHLLNFVNNSSCTVKRNGKSHRGKEIVNHILKKYKYFKGDIENTEQFIEYSATKSTMSGRYYMVRCGNENPIKTQDWLLMELETYRKKKENDTVQSAS